MRRAHAGILVGALVLLGGLVGCPTPPPPADTATPRPQPITLSADGVVRTAALHPDPDGAALPDQATLRLAVLSPSGPAGEAARLAFHRREGEARAERPTKSVWKESSVTLPAGDYDVHVRYRAAPTAEGAGWVRGLHLEAGAARRLELSVRLETGRLAVRLLNGGRTVGAPCGYRVWRAEDALDAPPVVRGEEAGEHVLPLGRYRVEAQAAWSETVQGRAAREEVVLDAERPEQALELDFGVRLGALEVSASIDGESVDDAAEVAVFPAGRAGAAPGRPLAKGWGGERLVLPEGRYDVRVRYRSGPLLQAERWAPDQRVPGDGGEVTLPMALSLEAGTLRFRVLRDGVRQEGHLRLRFHAADAGPDEPPLGEVEGAGPVRLPPGRYDVEIVHAPPGGPPRTHRERGVVVREDREQVREVRM